MRVEPPLASCSGCLFSLASIPLAKRDVSSKRPRHGIIVREPVAQHGFHKRDNERRAQAMPVVVRVQLKANPIMNKSDTEARLSH